jgi:hypothetical protein
MLWEFIDPQYLKSKLDLIDISLTSLRDAIRGTGARTLTDIYDATNAFSGKFPSAVALSDSLGNPTTTIVGSALLGFDGSNWRRVAVDASSRLRVSADVVANPPNFDVPLSTRASESTLSAIKAQTDKLTFDTAGRLAIQNPPNLDVALSTRASESTLSAFSGKFPSAVALADNLGNPTTTIIGAANLGFDGTNWRRLASDTSGRLRVSADVVANPPNLDVALSSRASESTLSAFSGKFPSAVAMGDAMSNPTATVIGVANLGFDGSNWRRMHVRTVDVLGATGGALATVDFLTPSRQPVLIEGISVGTTEGSTSISAPGAKWLKLKNRGDVDILIGINGAVPTTNPLKVKPRTILVIPFAGVTQVNYKVASGSSILDIEYYN